MEYNTHCQWFPHRIYSTPPPWHTPVAATTVCNTPDDGRPASETCRVKKTNQKEKKLHLVGIYITSLILYPSMILSEEASFFQFLHLKFCNHFLSSSYRIRFCLVSYCNFKAKTYIGIIPRYVYLFWVQVYVFVFYFQVWGVKTALWHDFVSPFI